jgi:feruloyl esterase
MARRISAGLLVALILAIGQLDRPAAFQGTPCADLAALTIPDVTINAASAVPEGAFTPPGSKTALNLPAFCRVEATARPTSDSEIKIEVWIPAETWNEKFQGVGNGGYMGSISYPAMALALRRGYATASTDTGHTGDDVIFGKGHPEKVIDFGWRAIHVMTNTAKLVIRNATGRFAEKSYFVGCSSGGHQALSEHSASPRITTASWPAPLRTIGSGRRSGLPTRGRPRTAPTARRSSISRHCSWSRSPWSLPATQPTG